MNCYFSGKPATCMCVFCGRFMATEHRESKLHIQAAFDEDADATRFVVVQDASWCGDCKPVSKPVSVGEIGEIEK